VPKPFPREFREDVVQVVRGRDSKTTIEQIARDFGIHPQTLQNWLRRADVEDGVKPGVTDEQNAELRELKRRNRMSKDLQEHQAA
jgi:transposase